MNKDEIIMDAMRFATTLTRKEFGIQAQARAIHQEYRQGAMDASIKILTSLNLSEEQYQTLMKQLEVEDNV
jgi:hypothetical protein